MMTGLRFAPGFGPKVIGIAACEFTDRRVPLDDVWSSRDMRQLVDRLAGSDDPGTVLEDLALCSCGKPDARVAFVEDVVERARRAQSVAGIADAVGLSCRRLQRRCLDAFGYGAKTLTRVLRMVDAVELARSGIAFADTAARSGYADQAHFARDVKELAGIPLGQLVSSTGRAANRSTELPSGS
jgi:AraC-like DNA-binding protein